MSTNVLGLFKKLLEIKIYNRNVIFPFHCSTLPPQPIMALMERMQLKCYGNWKLLFPMHDAAKRGGGSRKRGSSSSSMCPSLIY